MLSSRNFVRSLILSIVIFNANKAQAFSLFGIDLPVAHHHIMSFIDSKDPYHKYRIGLFYLKNGDESKAIQFFKESLKVNIRFSLAYNQLGKIYLKKGNMPEAIKNFQLSSKGNVKLYDTFVNLGHIYYEHLNLFRAARAFQMAIRLNPKDVKSMVLIGDIFAISDSKENSFLYYDKAKDVDPGNFYSILGEANKNIFLKKYKDSMKLAKVAIKKDEKNYEGYLTLSLASFYYGEFESFLKNAKKAESLTKFDGNVLYNLANANYYNGNFDEAIKIFEKLQNEIKNKKSKYKFLLNLDYDKLIDDAILYENDLDDTTFQFDLKSRTRSIVYYLNYLQLKSHDKKEMLDRAYKLLEKSVAEDFYYWRPQIENLKLLIESNKYNEFDKVLNQIITSSKMNHNFYIEVAKMYYKRGDLKQSEKIIDLGIKEYRGKSIELRLEKAIFYERLGRYIQAMDYLSKIGEIKDSEVEKKFEKVSKRIVGKLIEIDEVRGNKNKKNRLQAIFEKERGNTFWELGDFAKARDSFEKSIKIDPKYSYGFFRYGEFLMERDEKDFALKYFKMARLLKPNSYRFAKAMLRFYSKYENWTDLRKFSFEMTKVFKGPEQRIFKLYLGQAFLNLDEPERAVGEVKKLIKEKIEDDDEYVMAQIILGLAQEKRKKRPAMREALILAMERKPNNFEILKKLFFQLIEDKNAKQALRYGNLALKLNKEDDELNLAMAHVYVKNRYYIQALRFFEQSKDRVELTVEDHLAMGTSYCHLNNQEKAQEAYEIASNINFDQSEELRALILKRCP